MRASSLSHSPYPSPPLLHGVRRWQVPAIIVAAPVPASAHRCPAMTSKNGANVKSTPLVCSGHTRPIPSLSFSELLPASAGGNYILISACKDGKPMLRSWTGDWIGTFLGHKGAVWSAKLSGDGSRAVTGSADFSAKVWDTFGGESIVGFQHEHIVRSVDITPDSSHVFTGGMEKVLRRFDLTRPDAPPDIYSMGPNAKSHESNIKSVIWDTKRSLLISGSEDGTLRWWDPRLGASSSFVSELKYPTGIRCVERSFFTDDHLSLASGKRAVFLDMATRKPLNCSWNGPEGEGKDLGYEVSACTLQPGSGERVVTGSGGDGWVRVYDSETGDMTGEHKGHHGPVHSVSFSPDGELYASGSEDGTIRLWQTTPKTYGLWRYDANGSGT